ncbi:AarF/UbiB family protein [Tessaracoccus lubricantis]|uniref:AarF/UbiB family protein n=1 Tax=Tessaracoccus lubricantis TaxID=545543 RepID=A0ABP9F5N7_9ACTN
MDALGGAIGALVNVLILIYVARRLLGVPVGWGRAALVSAAVFAVTYESLDAVMAHYGLDQDTEPLPLTLLLVVSVGCLITFELIVLTLLEVFIPTRNVPSFTQFVTGIPAALRRVRRYVAIWWIVTRRGLSAYLGPASKGDVESPRVARSLRRALTDAGVTFVKFGQMLSTRADLLPPAFVRELSKLHSQVEAEPWAAVRPVIDDELGRPLEEVFAELDETPLAAASVAQIHTARLVDGTDVVVKVQRPRARRQVTADLDILDRMAHRLEKTTVWGRQIGAVGLSDGFAASLHEELDYRVEVANMRGVAAASSLKVPQVYDQFSGERVIVMERLHGQPLSAADVDALAPHRRAELAEELLSGVLRQIFVTGVFHADLHPGNVVLTDDGELALLDFGSVGRLDRPTRSALVMLLFAVERQDSIAATDALLDLMDRPDDLDDRDLEREVGGLIVRYGDGLAPGGSAAMFTALLDLVVRHGFRVPPQLAAVFRTLGTLDGTLRLLDPDIDLMRTAKARGAEVARELTGRDAIKQQVDHQLATLLPILARLPRRISRITEQLEDGTLAVNVRTLGHPVDRAYLAGIGGQLNLTLLGSALGIGGLYLLTRDGGPMLLPQLALWPFLGVTLLFLAFTLGARVLASIFFREH